MKGIFCNGFILKRLIFAGFYLENIIGWSQVWIRNYPITCVPPICVKAFKFIGILYTYRIV